MSVLHLSCKMEYCTTCLEVIRSSWLKCKLMDMNLLWWLRFKAQTAQGSVFNHTCTPTHKANTAQSLIFSCAMFCIQTVLFSSDMPTHLYLSRCIFYPLSRHVLLLITDCPYIAVILEFFKWTNEKNLNLFPVDTLHVSKNVSFLMWCFATRWLYCD